MTFIQGGITVQEIRLPPGSHIIAPTAIVSCENHSVVVRAYVRLCVYVCNKICDTWEGVKFFCSKYCSSYVVSRRTVSDISCVCLIVATFIHACRRTYIHTYIHTYTNTYMHTHIHTYMHTYTHTYNHTYLRRASRK